MSALPSIRGHRVLSASTRRLGELLIEQQMWCWGCDVRRPDGNLLLAYGFRKRLAPVSNLPSAYSVGVVLDRALTLWGWGLWLAAPELGTLLIRRSRFRVAYRSDVILEPVVWRPVDLPAMDKPRTVEQLRQAQALIAEAAEWIADYERWVAAQVSPTIAPPRSPRGLCDGATKAVSPPARCRMPGSIYP